MPLTTSDSASYVLQLIVDFGSSDYINLTTQIKTCQSDKGIA